jgi:predicted nucleotidyltransferase component of viral defense system
MKDYLLELTASETGFNAKLNIMREYLQANVLRIFHDEGLFRSTAFLGGSALRFLYGLPRFSEGLDFSLKGKESYPFVDFVKKLKRELELMGYKLSVKYNDKKMVYYAFLKFEGIMYEAGISDRTNKKFSIKIEIDTNPPEGAVTETKVVNKYFPIAFLSYEIESLFAGKLHALLSREYTKGRDFFDLGWYVSRWGDLCPNMTLLHNALKQTGYRGELPQENNWKEYIYKVVKKADWNRVKEDVENFLENQKDLDVFTKENVLNLVKGS